MAIEPAMYYRHGVVVADRLLDPDCWQYGPGTIRVGGRSGWLRYLAGDGRLPCDRVDLMYRDESGVYFVVDSTDPRPLPMPLATVEWSAP